MWGCKKQTCLRLCNNREEWWDMDVPRRMRKETSLVQQAAIISTLQESADRATAARTRGGERGALMAYTQHAIHKGGRLPLAFLPHTPNGLRVMALTVELHNDWGEAPQANACGRNILCFRGRIPSLRARIA